MEALATYLIKSSVWLTGFALVYALFLRNERFFTLNRIYLVSGILVSVIFPFFTWHYTVLLPVVPSVEISDPQIQGIVVPEESFTSQNALLFLYLSGIIYLTYRIIRQTLPVFRIIRKSELHQYSTAKLIRTAEYPASFSFFSFVFVNPSIDEIETNEIVNHEMEHVRQQHWIDLLLFEILRTILWFNPVSWLYGRFIRQNHEYLADERALQRTSNPAIYRAALLNQMFGGPVISLANSFNYSLNKKRFNMMKQTISSPIRKLKLLLVLPLMAGVFYAFAAPEYKFVQANNNSEAQSQTKDGKTVTGKVVNEDGKPLKGASIVVSGKTIGTITDANGNFKLEMPDESPIVISYVGFDSQKVEPDFEKEMVITMKTATIGIDMGDIVSNSKSMKIPVSALIFIDGKESTKAEMDKLNPDKIEKIDILKNQASLEKYGEKAKDGVILITLKNNNQNPQTFKVQTSAPLKFSNIDDSGNQLLIVKDGIIMENQNINNISPETIESIDVLKGESATKLFGEKGRNGVILIKTKKEASASQTGTTEVKVTGYANDQKENQSNSGIQIRSTGNSVTEPKPLIVIDGVITENQNIDKIDPETIESMNVLKDESATAKYGEKGKNGVVEITSKSKTHFTLIEEMPSFPGGVEALRSFVSSTMKYPVIALENGIQGQVKVKFVVAKDGTVTNARLFRGVDPSLDKEALRIVESMPTWIPGKQNGENVNVAYEMPINFKLPSDWKIRKEKLGISFRTGIKPEDQAAENHELTNNGSAGNGKIRYTLKGSDYNGDVEVSIYDKDGKLIRKESKNGPTFILSYSGLNGFYFIYARAGSSQYTGYMSVSTKTFTSKSIPKKEAKVKPTVEQAAQNHQLIIVPNPTKDKATITLEGSDSNKKLTVTIYGIDGKLFKKETKSGPTFSLSLASLTSGTYLIVADDGTNQFSGQLVVNH